MRDRFPLHVRGRGAAVALLVAVCVGQGCGTGVYKERMDARIAQLRQGGGSSAALYKATQVGDTSLWIRVPTKFSHGMEPGGANAMRVQPPITLPGLKATWEGLVDHEGKKLPFKCYLAVSGKNPADSIQREIKQLYEGTEVEWSDVTDSSGKTWKQFRKDLEQDWIPQDAGGKALPKVSLTGMFQINYRQEGSQWMIVAWSVPREIESAAGLRSVIPACLGSLETR